MPPNIIPVGISLARDADLKRQTGRRSRCECVGGALAGTMGIVVAADEEPLRSDRGLECRELAGEARSTPQSRTAAELPAPISIPSATPSTEPAGASLTALPGGIFPGQNMRAGSTGALSPAGRSCGGCPAGGIGDRSQHDW